MCVVEDANVCTIGYNLVLCARGSFVGFGGEGSSLLIDPIASAGLGGKRSYPETDCMLLGAVSRGRSCGNSA